MALKWCSDADSAIEKLMSDGCRDTDYVIFTLEGKNSMVIQPGHIGKGGRDKVEELLSSESTSSQVMTGAFLALAVDERGSVVSTRRKYIHFTWVGPSVGVMVKGRVNSMSGSFRDRFPGAVIYLQLMGDLDTLKAKTLEKNMLAAGGAHKPTRYDFTNAALDGTQVGGTTAPPKPVPSSPPPAAKEEPNVVQPVQKQEVTKSSFSTNTPLSTPAQHSKPAFGVKSKPASVTVVAPQVEVAEVVKAESAKKFDSDPEPTPELSLQSEPAPTLGEPDAQPTPTEPVPECATPPETVEAPSEPEPQNSSTGDQGLVTAPEPVQESVSDNAAAAVEVVVESEPSDEEVVVTEETLEALDVEEAANISSTAEEPESVGETSPPEVAHDSENPTKTFTEESAAVEAVEAEERETVEGAQSEGPKGPPSTETVAPTDSAVEEAEKVDTAEPAAEEGAVESALQPTEEIPVAESVAA
jgi:hypothetical protein